MSATVMPRQSVASSTPRFRDTFWRHGMLDHPLEPVTGLAEGEIRWRMTVIFRLCSTK
jgi:hypothetical protein